MKYSQSCKSSILKKKQSSGPMFSLKKSNTRGNPYELNSKFGLYQPMSKQFMTWCSQKQRLREKKSTEQEEWNQLREKRLALCSSRVRRNFALCTAISDCGRFCLRTVSTPSALQSNAINTIGPALQQRILIRYLDCYST